MVHLDITLCRAFILDRGCRFDRICENVHPVLHHFFLENYPTAPSWFERRLSYTRSVAVSSMAGVLYII